MRNKQYKYLDLLKVIAIFFVCMYHFWYGAPRDAAGLAGAIRKYLYSILSTCVPLFFAVNGALLLNREHFDANKHCRKLLGIFLQYCIWHGITAVMLGIAAGVDFSSLHKNALVNIFLLLGTTDGVDLNHFWFVPSLCGIYVLYPFLKSVFDRERENDCVDVSVICLFVVVYFVCFFLHDFSIFRNLSSFLMYLDMDPFQLFNPFSLRIGTMLTYFLLGGYLHRYRHKTQKIPAVICVLMIAAGLLLSYGMVTVMSWQGGPYFDIVFEGYNTTGTLLCTAGIFLLAEKAEEKIPSKGVFRFAMQNIGRNTMTIYYVHWILGYTLLSVLPFGYGCFWNLLKAGLFVLCGTLMGEGLKRIPLLKYLVH